MLRTHRSKRLRLPIPRGCGTCFLQGALWAERRETGKFATAPGACFRPRGARRSTVHAVPGLTPGAKFFRPCGAVDSYPPCPAEDRGKDHLVQEGHGAEATGVVLNRS
jgi:hypothetical protein